MLDFFKKQLKEAEEKLKDLYKQRLNASIENRDSIQNRILNVKKECESLKAEIAEEEKKVSCKKSTQDKTLVPETAEIPTKSSENEEIKQAITVFQQKTKELGYTSTKEDIAEMLSIRDKINEEIFKGFDEQIKYVTAKQELMYASPVFDTIFTSKELTTTTKQDIANIRSDKENYQYYDRCVIVSALTLSLINFKFDAIKADLLLDFVSDFEGEVWQAALTGLMMVLMTQNRSWLRAKPFVKRLQTLQKNDEIQDAIRMIDFILYHQLYKINLIDKKVFEMDLFKNPMYYFLPFYENNKILNEALDNAESDIDTDDFQEFLENIPLLASHKYALCSALKENELKFGTKEAENNDNKHHQVFLRSLNLADNLHPFQNLITEYYCFFKFFPAQKAKDIFNKQLRLSNNTKLKKAILNRKNDLLIDANRAYENGEYKAAKTKYEEILAIDSSHKEAKEKLAGCYLTIGNSYAAKKEYDKAIGCFQKAIELKSDFHEAFYNMGVAHNDKKEYDKAIGFYKKAIAIKPDKHEAFNNMGSAYDDKKEYDKAIENYEKAIAIKPDDHEVFNNMGNTYAAKKEYDKAIGFYDKAIELKPKGFHEAFYNMGNAYFAKKEYDKAIAACKKAIEIKPDKHEAFYNWGYCLIRINKIEEAKKKIDKGISLGGLDYGYKNLAHIFLLEQKETEALQHYQKSLQAFEDKERFWEVMKTDYEDLHLQQYGISLAYYEEVLEGIKAGEGL